MLVPQPDGYYSEALDSDLKFTSVADDDDTWYVDDGGWAQYYYDGDSARTDDTLDDSNETCLQTIVVCDSNETIKFYWKVSSEEDADYLQFYIDDTLKDQISGEVDWQQKSCTVDAGTRILKWRYVKDSSGYDGDDCGWVDFVEWTGPSPAQDPSNWQEIAYKHDVLGRRVEKKVDGYSTRYCYDGPHIIAEYDGNNNLLRKYIYGPGIDQPVCMIEVADANAVYYYHFDALGSVVALSDAAGDTVQTYEYSVYGEVAVEDANHPNPYMFAGVRYDIEIGLYYNRARYYNPFTGRFLQTDPIGYKAGMELYAYCGNNPVRRKDPSGLWWTNGEGSLWHQDYPMSCVPATLVNIVWELWYRYGAEIPDWKPVTEGYFRKKFPKATWVIGGTGVDSTEDVNNVLNAYLDEVEKEFKVKKQVLPRYKVQGNWFTDKGETEVLNTVANVGPVMFASHLFGEYFAWNPAWVGETGGWVNYSISKDANALHAQVVLNLDSVTSKEYGENMYSLADPLLTSLVKWDNAAYHEHWSNTEASAYPILVPYGP